MAETARTLIRLLYSQYNNPSNDILISIWRIIILWHNSLIFIVLSHITGNTKYSPHVITSTIQYSDYHQDNHIVVSMAETIRPPIRLPYSQYDNPSNDILIPIWWIIILWHNSLIFIVISMVETTGTLIWLHMILFLIHKWHLWIIHYIKINE